MGTQADKSKTRMNFTAIKKVDPYAKEIVDTSSHVAFYIFNEERNEWEKTDVEGALFIYSRTAPPFHSIFINNRLNTTAFVEPINQHLELQPQPPFLLYRNERSRIRGFWFYSSEECERLSKLAKELVQNASSPTMETNHENIASIDDSNGGGLGGSGRGSVANGGGCRKQNNNNNVNIFKMLSNAQQEYNAQLSNQANVNSATVAAGVSNPQTVQQQNQQRQQMHKPQAPQNLTSGNVLKFFAAAKPATDVAYTPRILPNTLSVEQLEKQQRDIAPGTQSFRHMSEDDLLTATSASTVTPTTPTIATNIYGLKQQSRQQQQLQNQDMLAHKNRSSKLSRSLLESGNSDNFCRSTCGIGSNGNNNNNGGMGGLDMNNMSCKNNIPNYSFPKSKQAGLISPNNISGEQIPLNKMFLDLQLQERTDLIATASAGLNSKPALMPPTMFDKPISAVTSTQPDTEELAIQNLAEQNLNKREPLTKFEFVQAFNYLIQNDDEFVQRLHDAYLKTLTKFGTYQ